MHGRPSKAPTPEEEKALALKAAKLRQSGHSSLDQELQLLGVFLKKDSRNFHAWNYQRFVAALKNRSDEEELHFTTDLINENFSHYSSWHNRSVILSHLLEKRAQGSFSKEKVLTEEILFEGVSSSTITVQSFPSLGNTFNFSQENLHSLQTHPVMVSLGHSQGIVSLSGFHHCLPTHFEFTVLIQPHGSQHAEMESAEMISWRDENFHTGETHLQEPTQIKNFDQLRNSEVNESTASKWSAETIVNEIALFRELLSEINWDSASSGTNNYICLRLNNLSLSHIGSIEKLLWVQMLDLSHNQLSSIEGLQAMQLFSCLNLSNNKMGSFSALEPLKLLKPLKVLDISYNEIGAHAVDTRSGVSVTNYWEAFAIFKDSKLTQLDIIGNVVAEEEFKLFLVKILPALNWLDGVELH
ncbi:unnamed protein product [Camellia sinensis]